MTKIILNGYLGMMGRVVYELAKKDANCEIVAGIDVGEPKEAMCFPTFSNPRDCMVQADVIIDFSHPDSVPALLDYAADRKMPVVICTTGLSDETLEKIKATSKKTAVLRSANMTVGINLLANLLKQAAKILYETGFDIEITERHHNQKIDAPSGTALLLADSVNQALDNQLEYVHDRSAVREKRKQNELGLTAIRGGTIVGEHTVIFAGKDEVIEFTHKAHSKEVFAVGAISAAKFLKGKNPGFYNMGHVIQG